MRKILFIILIVVAFTSCKDTPGGTGGGGSNITPKYSLTLAWDSSPSDDVAGYTVYMGSSSNNYNRFFDVGDALTYTVKNLDAGTYYFACTASDSLGNESDYSNEIQTTVGSN